MKKRASTAVARRGVSLETSPLAFVCFAFFLGSIQSDVHPSARRQGTTTGAPHSILLCFPSLIQQNQSIPRLVRKQRRNVNNPNPSDARVFALPKGALAHTDWISFVTVSRDATARNERNATESNDAACETQTHRSSLCVCEAARVVQTKMSGKTSLVDVAFRATTLGLFATTVVSGAWFAATTAKGFMHYNAASEEARKSAGTGSESGGKGGGKS